ncbi:MAG TPA: hypothetical protein PKA64_03925 [Myxococcota bacterium]|nr:hypothetical protein [Myxococcota bacterium]
MIGLPTGPWPLPVALADDLARRYAEPHRAYHDLSHLHELAEGYRASTWRRPDEVWAALLWHDAVYEPGRPDNEARSAELALASGLEIDLGWVADLIRRTAGHGSAPPPDDPDMAQFLDLDMAILAAAPDRFDRYDAGVTAEYAPVVPPELFAAGRRHFFATLLDAPRIFHTDRLHAALDARARDNLRRAIARLDAARYRPAD